MSQSHISLPQVLAKADLESLCPPEACKTCQQWRYPSQRYDSDWPYCRAVASCYSGILSRRSAALILRGSPPEWLQDSLSNSGPLSEYCYVQRKNPPGVAGRISLQLAAVISTGLPSPNPFPLRGDQN